MIKKIELERRLDILGNTFGIFYLPDNKHTPFVSWFISLDMDNKEHTVDGHYHFTLDECLKDYNNRS